MQCIYMYIHHVTYRNVYICMCVCAYMYMHACVRVCVHVQYALTVHQQYNYMYIIYTIVIYMEQREKIAYHYIYMYMQLFFSPGGELWVLLWVANSSCLSSQGTRVCCWRGQVWPSTSVALRELHGDHIRWIQHCSRRVQVRGIMYMYSYTCMGSTWPNHLY